MAYDNAGIFLLLFSYGDVSSLENIRSKWVPEVAECVATPPVLVGTGESPFGESPVKDGMRVEGCPEINCSVQEAMARALASGLEMKQKRVEGKKGPGKKHHGSRKSSNCNVA